MASEPPPAPSWSPTVPAAAGAEPAAPAAEPAAPAAEPAAPAAEPAAPPAEPARPAAPTLAEALARHAPAEAPAAASAAAPAAARGLEAAAAEAPAATAAAGAAAAPPLVPAPSGAPPELPKAPAVAPPDAAPALQKVLATQPRPGDTARTTLEPRNAAEAATEAQRRWEALLESASAAPGLPVPPSYWGLPPTGSPLGLPGYLPGFTWPPLPYGLPPMPPWPRTAASPYGLPAPYHQAVPPLAALGAAAAQSDAAVRSLLEASAGSALGTSPAASSLPLPPGIVDADAVPWKLACSGPAPAAGPSRPPGLGATVAAAAPGGAAAGAFLLSLVNEEAAARKEGAEAGAAILQQLRAGPPAAAGAAAPRADPAGAELLRQLRPQQEPPQKPRWWLDPPGLADAESLSAGAVDGIVEASQRDDGSQWVWADGGWIKASGKYYCSYCRVFGNKLDPHLASENHKKRRAAAIKDWESWGDKRKQKGWH